MSDRIGVMSDGHLLQVGTPEDIYEHPGTRFVADFIGETSFLAGQVRAPSEVELDAGPVIRAETGDRAVGERVMLAIRPEKATIYRDDEAPDATEDNLVTGRVERRTYAGTTTSYEVRIGDESVTVRMSNVARHEDFAPEERVTVAWRLGAARVLEHDPTYVPTDDEGAGAG